jgi:hypothetical protein
MDMNRTCARSVPAAISDSTQLRRDSRGANARCAGSARSDPRHEVYRAARRTGAITLHVAGTLGSGPFTVTAYDAPTLPRRQDFTAHVRAAGGHLRARRPVTIPVKAKDTGLGGAEAFEIDTALASGPTTSYCGLVGQ